MMAGWEEEEEREARRGEGEGERRRRRGGVVGACSRAHKLPLRVSTKKRVPKAEGGKRRSHVWMEKGETEEDVLMRSRQQWRERAANGTTGEGGTQRVGESAGKVAQGDKGRWRRAGCDGGGGIGEPGRRGETAASHLLAALERGNNNTQEKKTEGRREKDEGEEREDKGEGGGPQNTGAGAEENTRDPTTRRCTQKSSTWLKRKTGTHTHTRNQKKNA